MAFTIRQDDPASLAIAELLTFHVADAHSETPVQNAHALGAAGLAVPEITFWSIWDDGSLAGFGALKELGRGDGEVKSMRTAPDHLRKGVARAMLAHIIAVARVRGLARLKLETGTAPSFAPAHRLYESFGFVDCPVYGDYPASPYNRFMALPLGD